jgi:hypothetical protein
MENTVLRQGPDRHPDPDARLLAGQFLTRVTADPCPACIDYLAFDFSCGANNYLMHAFTIDKGSGRSTWNSARNTCPAR